MSRPKHQEVRIPVSVGELADKITILEIKCERLKAEEKLASARKELEVLRPHFEKFVDTPEPALSAALSELRQVNLILWDVENEIRACERAGRFDETFVALARRVYQTNDRRSELKNTISRLTGSSIVEVKDYGS